VTFSPSVQFKGSEDFTEHLAAKNKEIKSKLQSLFTNLSAARGRSPDIQDLQGKLTKLLASQKEYMVKLDRLRAEKDEISERLETASLRYIKAEKRLDRAKSSAVAKLEQQAIAGTGNNAGSGIGKVEDTDVEMTNGIEAESLASQSAYKEAAAVVAQQKQQLEAITAENKSLTEQLTATNLRLTSLNEDDYARTELFKQFRIQHEDVIRRINHLEATNIQLREEAERFQAERTAYRVQLENEGEIITGELESQLQRVESDLTRIRSARDELLADLSMRKASQDQERTATEHLRELTGAKEERITALELEVERLRSRLEDQSYEPTPRPDLGSMDVEQLRSRYENMERQFESINKELPALQGAYKRVQALTTKKVMDFTALEEKMHMLTAEKSKADQKYFAARKDMDTRIGEVRTLRAQNAKSSEIIAQLKAVETSNRNLLSNLEKQLSDVKQSNTTIMTNHKKAESTAREASSKCDTLKNQVIELAELLKSKDSNNLATKQRIQAVELELEQLRVKYEHAQKDRDTWKQKSLSNQSGEEEMLRVSRCSQKPSNHTNIHRLLLSVPFAGRTSKIRS
jgi:E3 ubiquitin-protein ligase BRE1